MLPAFRPTPELSAYLSSLPYRQPGTTTQSAIAASLVAKAFLRACR